MDLPASTAPATPPLPRLLGLGLLVLLLHAGLFEWLLAEVGRSLGPARAGPPRPVQVVAQRALPAQGDRAVDSGPAAGPLAPTAQAAPTPAAPQPPPQALAALSHPGQKASSAAAASAAAVAATPVEGLVDEEAPASASVADADTELHAAPPVYPTRLPAPTTLHFAVQRLAAGSPPARPEAAAEAVLQWRHDGSRYLASLSISGPRRPTLEQSSSGGIDGDGLAPERFVDRRRGRLVGAAHFRRDSGRISFSGPSHDFPAWPGAQDRLTWLPQLVAVVLAAAPALPEQISLFVADARGQARLWRFESLGLETISGTDGPVATLHLLRPAQRPDDLRVEVWLDPSQGYWPLRLSQTAPFGGARLEWQLRQTLPAEALPEPPTAPTAATLPRP